MTDRIVLFMPVYNEEEALARIFPMIPAKIFNYDIEIVVVDDCSDDRSLNIVADFTKHIVKLEKNMGVGYATKIGFEYIANMGIDFRYLIKLDGDGQHNIDYIPQIVAGLREGSDVVVCSRFHPLSNHAYTPIDRILLNCIFNEMVSKITGWHLTDVRSGYMGVRFDLIRQIASKMIVRRYGVPMEILLRIWGLKKDAKVTEIPHPALYGGDVSRKMQQKYSSEMISQKASRLEEAYNALLTIVNDMQIPREEILEMNGYRNY
jgi:hypothetical protein